MRFTIEYLVNCLQGETIQEKALGIALEQSVELPSSVLDAWILNNTAGKVESIKETGEKTYLVECSYAVSTIDGDLTQFLNVLLGNISLKPGIQVINVDWEPIQDWFPGPRFGVEGVRINMGIPNRPLSCSALKPLGLSIDKLADLAFQFATGGIDIIKDDHGIADQRHSPFTERVKACVEAVNHSYDLTGKQTWYFPNVTTKGSKLIDRFRQAEDLGAHGVLLCPQLCGLEMMADLASSDVNLPIMAHPAFSGTYLGAINGFSHSFLYGSLWRAFGADFVIYPNHGGRFSFSLDECIGINQAALDPMVPYARTFPTPGGGVDRNKIPEWRAKYGNDIVFLMGASLYKHPEGIKAATIEVQEALNQ